VSFFPTSDHSESHEAINFLWIHMLKSIINFNSALLRLMVYNQQINRLFHKALKDVGISFITVENVSSTVDCS